MRRLRTLHLLSLPLLSSAAFFGLGGEWPDDINPSTFNGRTVPPLTALNGSHFDDKVKSGHWLVEFYSPYCSHCQAFAPTYKTLYEYYYTQEPVPQAEGSASGGDDDLNSFSRYYDFRFAKVDCVANADLCSIKDVKSFPTIRFYKDGAIMKEALGTKDLKFMSNGVEDVLESIRPGSRPQGGPVLPKVGATSAEAVPANAPVAATTTYGGRGDRTTVAATRLPVTGPHGTPNPFGKSTPLNAENFQRLVTNTRDPWFIKFYMPWCHHCQDMAPNWQGMARQMEGRLNVGEVNCEADRRLCKVAEIKGYPTIIFFRGEERLHYDGLRGLGDLITYANEAVSVCDGVKSVSEAEFDEMEKTEDVIFLYFYDHATTNEDFAALDRLPMSLVGHAKLVKTDDPVLAKRYKISTWPRLIVSRDSKQKTYPGLSPKDMRDKHRVVNWMKANWLPLVPELTAGNAREIMDHHFVVLGILNRDRPDELWSAKREIKNAAVEWITKEENAFRLELEDLRQAKQLRIEEAKDRGNDRAMRAANQIHINMNDIERPRVHFAWVDGVFWERWIKTTFGVNVVRDGEKVVVNDEDNKRYWDLTTFGNPIVPSRTSILETLPRIVANPPKLSPKSTTTALGHVWWVIRGQIYEHPIISACLSVVVVVAMFLWSRKIQVLPWRSLGGERGYGYFKVGMGEKGSSPMDGLLGVGGQQGKKD